MIPHLHPGSILPYEVNLHNERRENVEKRRKIVTWAVEEKDLVGTGGLEEPSM